MSMTNIEAAAKTRGTKALVEALRALDDTEATELFQEREYGDSPIDVVILHAHDAEEAAERIFVLLPYYKPRPQAVTDGVVWAVARDYRRAAEEIVRFGLDHGANFAHTMPSLGHHLAQPAGLAIWKMLMAVGVGPDSRLPGTGDTALIGAAAFGCSVSIQHLIACGADVNKQNGVGSTPLHFAMLSPSPDAALLLLKNGADPDLPNKSGETVRASLLRGESLAGGIADEVRDVLLSAMRGKRAVAAADAIQTRPRRLMPEQL